MVTAARRISQTYHCAVLCKGGHSVNDANDLLYADGTLQWFRGRRIANSNTHGTGLYPLQRHRGQPGQRVFPAPGGTAAKDYVSQALAAMLDLGQGSGPLHHGFALSGTWAQEAPAACPVTRFPLCFFPLLAATGQIHYAERRNTRRLLSMFQENLKNYRKAKGLTQEDLAVRLHVVRQTISKWEKGVSLR